MKYNPVKIAAATLLTLSLVGLLSNNKRQDNARKAKDAAFVMKFAGALQRELEKLPSKPALDVYVKFPLGDDARSSPDPAIKYAFADRGPLNDYSYPGNAGQHRIRLLRRGGYVSSPEGEGIPMAGRTGEDILNSEYLFDSQFSITDFDLESTREFIPDTVQTDVRFRGDVFQAAARIAGNAKDFQGFISGKNKKIELSGVLICPSP